ncbi:MAG: hypothetical protein KAY37_14075 [Phycisphaerae bacterium]|nr:hypothetical protein [Phycisphaerae bacterium]
MSRLYIRHVSVVVFLAAVLARHWVPWLRPPGDEPFSFVVGLGIGIGLAIALAVYQNRAQSAARNA